MVPVNTSVDAHLDQTVAPILGAQLNAIRQRVAASNTPTSLNGLLAHHILGSQADLAWNVQPSISWLQDTSHRIADPATLAVLGYVAASSSSANDGVRSRLLTGLPRLMQRDLFPGDRLTFIHDIRILIGVGLAVQSVATDLPDAASWLRSTLADPRLQPADPLHELVREHTLSMLGAEPAPLPSPLTLTGTDELAMAHWMLTRGTGRLAEPAATAPTLQQCVLRAVLRTDPSELTPPIAALLLNAATSIVDSSVDQLVLSRSRVGLLLRRFHAAMRRWRWDSNDLQHPIRWEVRSEREIQDILWLMLRSTFDDVIDEDTLPKFGHSSYRADFGLPRLGILVEVKYAYQASDFKKIEQEVMIDSIAYLKNTDRYREIIVFVYDESQSVEHHDTTRMTLLDLDGVADVVIASRPGGLPVPARRGAHTGRRALPAETATAPVHAAQATRRRGPPIVRGG